jgi:hypothetical protein
MIEDKQKALEAMKKAGELADLAVTEPDRMAAWNQKKLALDLCSDSLVPYDQMLAAYMQGLNILKH